jgi:hypothetical protein
MGVKKRKEEEREGGITKVVSLCTWAVAHFIRKLEKKKKRKKERKKNVEAIYLAIFGSEF